MSPCSREGGSRNAERLEYRSTRAATGSIAATCSRPTKNTKGRRLDHESRFDSLWQRKVQKNTAPTNSENEHIFKQRKNNTHTPQKRKATHSRQVAAALRSAPQKLGKFTTAKNQKTAAIYYCFLRNLCSAGPLHSFLFLSFFFLFVPFFVVVVSLVAAAHL